MRARVAGKQAHPQPLAGVVRVGAEQAEVVVRAALVRMRGVEALEGVQTLAAPSPTALAWSRAAKRISSSGAAPARPGGIQTAAAPPSAVIQTHPCRSAGPASEPPDGPVLLQPALGIGKRPAPDRIRVEGQRQRLGDRVEIVRGRDLASTGARRIGASGHRLQRLADDRPAGRLDLVEAADGGRVGGVLGELGVGLGLGEDLLDRFGEGVEALLGLGLGRLDHQRLVDQEREVDGRRVEAEVEQALGEVEGGEAESRFIGLPAEGATVPGIFVGVGEDRVDVAAEGRRRALGVAGRARFEALEAVPAVVGAFAEARRGGEVDLLPGALADVADPEVAGEAVEGEAEGIAQAEAPDFGGGDSARGGEPQDLAEPLVGFWALWCSSSAPPPSPVETKSAPSGPNWS